MKPEEFTDHYTIVQNHVTPQNGDFFETYGDDLEYIKGFIEKHPKRVWTVMDSEVSNDIVIVAGAHYVNRINYVITEEEWKDWEEIYMWSECDEEYEEDDE